MGCVTARATCDGVAGHRADSKAPSGVAIRPCPEEKTDPSDADYIAQFVAGYTNDYPQKGTVSTYEDYRGFETSTMNHMSKNKADKLCKWGDEALQDRLTINNDFFFNPQNPSSWPKDVLADYFRSPSFADRRTVQESAHW
ncbi:hypothetical protein JKF63_01480 [Porcisia hertigi]|uniref:Uncharacterized protein n=1 Tax=Porcisia hertigi TaxID=2761500 RepID=A0A836HY53_9TRYP|nr:hypothetical protein JKF63_01480 [Porcisia hertigi]